MTRARPGALARCLESFLAQEGAPRWELLVAADDDPGVTVTVDRTGVDVTVVPTVGMTLGENRNVLVDKARGELLVFVDDDVCVPPGFLAQVAALAGVHPGVSVFGGPNLTPGGAGRFAQVQGRLLATPWLTGPVSRRYRSLPRARGTRGSGLTLCNLVVRAAAGPRFPVGQRGGEENAMLAGLRRGGHRMLLHPGLAVAHERRSTVVGFATQVHKYGYGRGELLARRLGFGGWAAMVVGAALVARRPRWWVPPAAAPLVVAVVAGLRASPDGTHRVSDVAQAVVVPFGYGFGVLHGLVRWRRASGRRAGRYKVVDL